MKIYTKTGDGGETGLLGGVRVSKSHLAIGVCGSLDETNSLIGSARCALWTQTNQQPKGINFDDVDQLLSRIQNELFDLGSRVASCLGESQRTVDFPAVRSEELEQQIDFFESELPPLRAFILPGGNAIGSSLHLARSVCRRAEREIVALVQAGVQRPLGDESIYLNRLGDLLFVLARTANVRSGFPETQWVAQGGKKPE